LVWAGLGCVVRGCTTLAKPGEAEMWTKHADRWFAVLPEALKDNLCKDRPLVIVVRDRMATIEWCDHELRSRCDRWTDDEIVRLTLELLGRVFKNKAMSEDDRARVVSVVSWVCSLPKVPHG
jgi:hypothetical protein